MQKIIQFQYLPLGSNFIHGATTYKKMSKVMATPCFQYKLHQVIKVRFKKKDNVELVKSAKVVGREGSKMELGWS